MIAPNIATDMPATMMVVSFAPAIRSEAVQVWISGRLFKMTRYGSRIRESLEDIQSSTATPMDSSVTKRNLRVFSNSVVPI